MRFLAAAIAFAVVVLPMRAGAAPTIAVTPGAGTSGIGGKVSVGIDARTELSVGAGAFVYHLQQTLNTNEVDVSTSVSFVERAIINQIPVTIDRRLGGGPLTVSAGVVFNNDHLSASSIPFTENVTIAGTVYSAATAGQAFADVHWHHLSPFVGFGYVPRRSGFTASVGGFFEGKSAVDIYETGAIAANRDKIAPDIASFESQLRKALGAVTIYPSATVGYRVRL